MEKNPRYLCQTVQAIMVSQFLYLYTFLRISSYIFFWIIFTLR